MALTRLQIMNEGLSMAGRTDLLSNARLWLNVFLSKMYKNFDFNWLIKTASGLAVVEGGALPTDYNKSRSAMISTDGNSFAPINVIDSDEYNILSRQPSATGVPRVIYIDHDAKVFRFWPKPDRSTYSLNFQYYYLPTLPTPSDNSGDNNTVKWEEDDDVLIQHIYAKALDYNDDPRTGEAKKERDQMVEQTRMNSHDMRAGKHRIKLGKSFRKRF